jgi:RND superfamily putative drug exporter
LNQLLERLGSFAARRYLIVIIGWVIILGGLVAAKQAFGGTYVNNYNVSGTDSDRGLSVLNDTYPQQGGYGGQIVFHSRSGKFTSADQSAINQASTNVSKLSHVLKSTSPFASPSSSAVSKDATIAYSVSPGT